MSEFRSTGTLHPRCNRLFLGTDGIGIDGRGEELGVAQPFLHHVEWYAGIEGLHAEAMAQALRRGLRTLQAGICHDDLHMPPRSRALPRPEMRPVRL